MKIKLVIFDFDGVFTNGKILFNNGDAIKHYNAKDGLGIFRLHDANITVGVISGWPNNSSQHSILEHLKIKYVSLGSNNKLQIVKDWCKKLDITLDNVVYMGDDLNDLKIMKEVKLSGCPNDAVKEVKEIADFVSTKNGGCGAIREYCEYILEIDRRYNLKVSVVIPSRKGSTRCKNKNLRKFGNTTLLENKINILKMCKNIDKIVVSSNDKESLLLAEQYDVIPYKRDDKYCFGNVPPAEVHKELARCIDTDVFVYSTPVSPFVTSKTIDNIIEYWRDHPEYQVVSAGLDMKNFIFYKNKPYNFKIDNGIVGTQTLSDNYKIACADAVLVCEKENVLKHSCIFGDGNSIYLYSINELESIDIDWNLDFVISESLFHRSFKTMNNVDDYMTNYDYKRSMILDCTIRDTGYLNNWNWDYETVKNIVYYLGEVGVDYCEIGFLKDERYVEDNVGIWRHLNSDLSVIKKLKQDTKTKAKIAVMMDIGGYSEQYYDVDKLPRKEETGIDLVRVFTFYGILDRVPEVCNKLKEKGYTVTLNIGHCAHLEQKEINNIKLKIKSGELNVDYLYFADSLGMLTPNEIYKFMLNLKDIYPVKNGFHNHDNHGTIFGNLINLLNCNIDILDGTISGFGKNGGNCNLEQLLFYLILKEGYEFNIEPLLELLEKIDLGKEFNINKEEIKRMLQQFMKVHSSYLNPIIEEPLPIIYKKLNKLKFRKKVWS